MRRTRLSALVCTALLAVFVGGPLTADDAPPERLFARVLEEFPHDPQAFTQGLLWHDGELVEGTGQYGDSVLRRVDPFSGVVLLETPIDPGFFGEGVARAGDRLIQLTWQAGVALVWDARTLAPLDQFTYRGEGWGLTFDGQRLIMSDGSARLTFRDPATFAEIGGVDVTLNGRPLAKLNELEAVDGAVWANVWTEDRIVRIDPASGRVTGIAELGFLLSAAERRRTDVLNGIAWDPSSETFWITGKMWPKIFQVVFAEAGSKR